MSTVAVAVEAEIGGRGAVRIVVHLAVLAVHLGSRVLAVVATDAIGVLAAHRGSESHVVTRCAVVAVSRVRSGFDRESTFGMGATRGRKPG